MFVLINIIMRICGVVKCPSSSPVQSVDSCMFPHKKLWVVVGLIVLILLYFTFVISFSSCEGMDNLNNNDSDGSDDLDCYSKSTDSLIPVIIISGLMIYCMRNAPWLLALLTVGGNYLKQVLRWADGHGWWSYESVSDIKEKPTMTAVKAGLKKEVFVNKLKGGIKVKGYTTCYKFQPHWIKSLQAKDLSAQNLFGSTLAENFRLHQNYTSLNQRLITAYEKTLHKYVDLELAPLDNYLTNLFASMVQDGSIFVSNNSICVFVDSLVQELITSANPAVINILMSFPL